MLPEGWKLKSLKQIGECISGLTYSPDNITDKENDGLLVLRSSNIKNGSIVLEDNVYVDCCIDDAKLTRLKDILICVRNGSKTLIGKSAIITNPAAIGQAHGAFMSVFRSESNEYVFQLFQTSMFFRQVSADLGATINSINTNNLLKYKFPFPPLPEQKKIAQILSTWDNAISATERLLENSQQRKKALMQQLLTGKKRLPGFEGEFKHVELFSVASITMGTSPKSESYNEEGYGLPLIQGNADIELRKSKPRIFTSEVTKTCFPGDILLSVRAPVGTVAISKHEACIGRGICALRATKGNNQDYLYQWMLWYEPRWSSLSQGSTFESVNSTDIKSLKLRLPAFIEQQAIASVLTTADQEIDALQKRLDHLKVEKKALMQQLLTGKRRVQVEEAA